MWEKRAINWEAIGKSSDEHNTPWYGDGMEGYVIMFKQQKGIFLTEKKFCCFHTRPIQKIRKSTHTRTSLFHIPSTLLLKQFRLRLLSCYVLDCGGK